MATTAKHIAHELIEQLPDDASWEDILYALYVRQQIEEGLDDVAAGRVTPQEDVRAELLDRRQRAS
jgi:predicted transcriptional regulator